MIIGPGYFSFGLSLSTLLPKTLFDRATHGFVLLKDSRLMHFLKLAAQLRRLVEQRASFNRGRQFSHLIG